MLSGVRYLQRSTIRDIPNDVLKVRNVKYTSEIGGNVPDRPSQRENNV